MCNRCSRSKKPSCSIDEDAISLDDSVIGNQVALLGTHGSGVMATCKDVPVWKRCSTESLRRWLPSPTQAAFGRRTSLPVFTGFEGDQNNLLATTTPSPTSSDGL